MVMWKHADTSYADSYRDINFRTHPELYKIGKGQQGVLITEPYKSEIVCHWRFKTPEIAKQSSEMIYSMFECYLENDDFVGADMAKKFLHMGYTRARRYANHASGKKYDVDESILPQEVDALTSEKAQSARIFYPLWKKAREHPRYLELKAAHIAKYGKS